MASLNAAQNARGQARVVRRLEREKAKINAIIAKAPKCACPRDPLVEKITLTVPTFCDTCEGVRVPEEW